MSAVNFEGGGDADPLSGAWDGGGGGSANHHVKKSSQLAPEMVESLKNSIDAHLRANNIYARIRGLVGEFLTDQQLDFSGEDQVIKALHQKGVIHDIVAALGGGPDCQSMSTGHPPILPNRRYLIIRIRPGAAFVDASSASNFSIFIEFGSQRLATRPVAAQVAPDFNDVFMIDLADKSHEAALSIESILQMKHKLHVVLIKEDLRSKKRELLAAQYVEWRHVLKQGSSSVALDLMSRQTDAVRAPIGILNMELEIAPLPKDTSETATVLIPAETIVTYIAAEIDTRNQAFRRFHAYAKAWWNDYLQIRPDHHSRIIKMFASNEDDQRVFVSLFLRPIHSSRMLLTARHAARFVRLIPYVPDIDLGGERTKIWNSLHSFLSRGYGDVEDHCVLLCSLLLGFGLAAYICCGHRRDGPHTWVITKESKNRVLMWESLTGQTYPVDCWSMDEKAAALIPFVSVGCVFNHKQFFANIQVDASVRMTQWDFSDASLWKSMTDEAIRVLPVSSIANLSPCTINPVSAAVQLEGHLGTMIEDWRRDNLQSETRWDEHLAHCIAPALAAYESQFVTGVSYGNDLFQQTIKNTVPLHFAFKALPCQFDHRDPGKIMAYLLHSPVAIEILNTTSSFVKFALRVFVVPYADNICATWVMLAVKWRSS